MFRPAHPQNFVLSVPPVLYSSLQSFAQTSRTSESNGNETPQSHRVQHASVPKNFEQFAVYWTEEAGWHTDLQLRNNLASKLVVTPALRSADGTEANLSTVTIQPGGVATVSLHQEIAKSAPQFNASYGSVVMRYRAPVSKALNAVAMVHLEGHPIGFHVDATCNRRNGPVEAARGSGGYLVRLQLNT